MSDILQERFVIALHDTARLWRLAIDRRLKSLGMSQASWRTVAFAAKAASPPSQSELAESLGVEAATMVTMVDRLVKAGLVLRQPSTTDRRVKRIVVTEAGKRLHESVQSEATAVRQQLLARIDPARLAAASEVLEVLRGMIEADL